MTEFPTSGSIVYYDDKKEKRQSHEARLMMGDKPAEALLDEISYIEITGYGHNPAEAKAELITNTKAKLDHLKRFTAALEAVVAEQEKE